MSDCLFVCLFLWSNIFVDFHDSWSFCDAKVSSLVLKVEIFVTKYFVIFV